MIAPILARPPGRVVLFALAVGLAFNAWLFNPQQWPLIGVDGKQFYAVAQVSARGEDPYATPILYAEQDRLFNPPGRPAGYAHTAYGYPPLFTAVLRAGAGLDPVAFYVVAAVLMLGVAVAGLELTLGALGVRRRWSARLMFAASPPLALCIFLANPSPVLLLGSAAALALSWSGRDFLAGVALALVMLKLPVGAPVAVALLLTAPRVPPARLLGAWLRGAGGLVLGIAALMLLQLLVVGGGGTAQWFAGLGGFGSGLGSQTTLAGLPGLFLGSMSMPLAVTLAALPVGAAVAWALWPRRRSLASLVGSPALVGLGMSAALAICPYLHLNDLVLELLPLLVLASRHEKWARSTVAAWLLLVPVGLVFNVLAALAFSGYRPEQSRAGFIAILLNILLLAGMCLAVRSEAAEAVSARP